MCIPYRLSFSSNSYIFLNDFTSVISLLEHKICKLNIHLENYLPYIYNMCIPIMISLNQTVVIVNRNSMNI